MTGVELALLERNPNDPRGLSTIIVSEEPYRVACTSDWTLAAVLAREALEAK